MTIGSESPPSVPVSGGVACGSLQRPLLLYNGGCRFCRWVARVIVRIDRDRALAFLSISDDAARPFVDAIPEPDRFSGWHLLTPEGTRLTGGPGVVRLLLELRWTRWLGRISGSRRVTHVLGHVDTAIARRKGRLGRRVPDGEAPRRFP